MKLIPQAVKLITHTPDPELIIERMGRLCYASLDNIKAGSHIPFIRQIISNGHTSVLEHVDATFEVITDLAVSHQFIRHRPMKELAGFSQQSTRFCNFTKDKFNNEVLFIAPIEFKFNELAFAEFTKLCAHSEQFYNNRIKEGWPPEIAARGLLRSLHTVFGVTANFSQWRYYLKTRLHKKAFSYHRQVAWMIKNELVKIAPIVFEEFTDLDWR
jgi:thymidylate synthase (FAD)